MKDLAQAIRNARRNAGLSVRRLAERTGLPVTVIRRYERGSRGAGEKAPSAP